MYRRFLCLCTASLLTLSACESSAALGNSDEQSGLEQTTAASGSSDEHSELEQPSETHVGTDEQRMTDEEVAEANQAVLS